MDEKFTAVLRSHLPFLPEGRDLRPDDALRDLGLNSMAAIELLFAVEDAYGAAIPDEMLDDTLFATVGSLWAALGRARAQAGAA